MAMPPARSAGASSRSAARRRSPRPCRWSRLRRCARRRTPPSRRRRSRAGSTASSGSATTRRGRLPASAARSARRCSKPRRDPRRQRQGPVRCAQHQPVPRRAQYRSEVDDLHHRRPQGARSSSPACSRTLTAEFAVRRLADASPKRGRSPPSRATSSCSGEVDQVRDRHNLHQHAHPGTGHHRIPAGRRNQGAAESSAPKPRRRCWRTRPRPSSSRARRTSSATCVAQYLNISLYHVLLNAKATEHSARMVAMKNATDNAKSSSRISPSNTTSCARPPSPTNCSKSPPARRRSSSSPANFSDSKSIYHHEHRQNRPSRRPRGGRRVSRGAAGNLQRPEINYTVESVPVSLRSKCSSTSATAGCAPSP